MKIVRKIKIILSVIFFTLILDLLLSQLLLLDLITKNKEIAHKEDIENRIFNKNYKYGFAKNKSFNSIYFGRHYVVKTNELGFRDKKIRKLDRSKNYSIIIGDSFVEGVTLDYKDSIVGILNEKIEKSLESFEFLNAGVASYSSYIYLKKIKTVLKENPWLKVNSVIIFMDKSDIHNDIEYFNEPATFKINPEWKYKNKRKIDFKKDLETLNLFRFFTKQTVSGLFIKFVGDRIEFFLRDMRDRFKLANSLNKSVFDIPKEYTDALRSINDKRFYASYFYGNNWDTIGKKSAQFSINNLLELKKILDSRNIQMITVLYPWSYEILEPIPRNNYLNFMENSFKKNNITFINLYDNFLVGDPYLVVSNNFIFNDIHYNSKGYKLLADSLFEIIKDKFNIIN